MILSYLGSKKTLLPQLESVIRPLFKSGECSTFCDLFMGSGCVANYFAKKCEGVTHVMGNDMELYSYVLGKGLLCCPYSVKLARVIDSFNAGDCVRVVNGLIWKHFSRDRLYFKADNAVAIDTVRVGIHRLFESGIVTWNEFLFLLASLLKSASLVANTSGTFRAHLKTLAKKADRSFKLVPVHTDYLPCRAKTTVFKKNATMFAGNHSVQHCVYIDPPYNNVHYSAYYSFLNYLCMYDKNVELVGTGIIRDYYKSPFGLARTAYHEFCKLFHQLQVRGTKYIIMSYSSRAILPIHILCDLMKSFGFVSVLQTRHRKYISNNKFKGQSVTEYIMKLKLK